MITWHLAFTTTLGVHFFIPYPADFMTQFADQELRMASPMHTLCPLPHTFTSPHTTGTPICMLIMVVACSWTWRSELSHRPSQSRSDGGNPSQMLRCEKPINGMDCSAYMSRSLIGHKVKRSAQMDYIVATWLPVTTSDSMKIICIFYLEFMLTKMCKV